MHISDHQPQSLDDRPEDDSLEFAEERQETGNNNTNTTNNNNNIIIMSISTALRLSGALSALQSSSIATKIHLYKSQTHTDTDLSLIHI